MVLYNTTRTYIPQTCTHIQQAKASQSLPLHSLSPFPSTLSVPPPSTLSVPPPPLSVPPPLSQFSPSTLSVPPPSTLSVPPLHSLSPPPLPPPLSQSLPPPLSVCPQVHVLHIIQSVQDKCSAPYLSVTDAGLLTIISFLTATEDG